MSTLASISTRHSQYSLTGTSKVSDEDVAKLVKDITVKVPSAFNSQPQRVVVLFGEGHKKVWDIVKDSLRKVVDDEEAFKQTSQKIDSFAAAHGTVLYFDDTTVTDGLVEKFPLYADNFPVWAQQSNGMLQFAVWTALSEAGLGASLQHYNPLINDAVRAAFELPEHWNLLAQMPFGDIVDPAGEAEHAPIDERVKVFGL